MNKPFIDRKLWFEPAPGREQVPALLRRPADAHALLVLGHGAGAGMDHPFLEGLSAALAARGIATLRYQFPYTAAGKRRPDPPALLESCARAAAALGAQEAGSLLLFAGGKSMGGRITSQAQAKAPLEGVRGLVFFGFPLHAAGAPSQKRGDHLAQTGVPLLFLQGSRDKLADLALLRPVVAGLGPRATLAVLDDGDHSFAVPKRAGKTQEEVLAWLAAGTERFIAACRERP
jgi:uncharacterized protein